MPENSEVVLMPVVQISWWTGRTDEQKKKVIEGITKVIAEALNIKPEAVTVIIYDIEKKNWGVGGRPGTEL
jgi:4-oxalocrotonate tautomerase